MIKKYSLKEAGLKALAFIFLFSILMLVSSTVIATNVYAANDSEASESAEEKQTPSHLLMEKKSFPFFSNHSLTSQSSINSTAATKTKPLSDSSDALTVSLGLIFILVLIFSLAWFMKKMGYSNVAGKGQLKIIETLNLGHKEKIALIQVGQQQLLVGMTATQINTLHILDEPITTKTDNAEFQVKSKEGLVNTNPFANKFSKFLNNKSINTK